MKIKLLIFLMFTAAQSLFASGASSRRDTNHLDHRKITEQEPLNPQTEIKSKYRHGLALFVPKETAESQTHLKQNHLIPDSYMQADDAYNHDRLIEERSLADQVRQLTIEKNRSDRRADLALLQIGIAQENNNQLRDQLARRDHAAAPDHNRAAAQDPGLARERLFVLQAERNRNGQLQAALNTERDRNGQLQAALNAAHNNRETAEQRAQVLEHVGEFLFGTLATSLFCTILLDPYQRKNYIESGLTREQANIKMFQQRFPVTILVMIETVISKGNSMSIGCLAGIAISMLSIRADRVFEPNHEKIKKNKNLHTVLDKYGLVMLDKNYKTPLMQTNNISAIKELIAVGVDINQRDIFKQTALMQTRSPEIAQLLIKAGADIEAFDAFSQTALMYAAENKKTEYLKILIENGANLYATNKDGFTALDIARNEVESCKKDFPSLLKDAQDCVALLKNAMKNPDEFKRSTPSKDSSSSVEKVIESEQKIQGAPVSNRVIKKIEIEESEKINPELLEVRDEYDQTPLMTADYKTARILIESGANINATTQGGHTALMINIKPSVTQLLIESGANIEATNANGETVLTFMTGVYYNKDCVKVLIENGANLYAKNKQGLTALDIARKDLENFENNQEYPYLQKALKEIIKLLEDAMSK